MSSDPCYTILSSNDLETSTVNELKNRLEKGSDASKVDAMRQIITSILNGDNMEALLMHVIRFVMPSKNKSLKKLLHFYWEVCPKYNTDGKLKQEMILVCNAIRNDLQHPNEFIRGATLRFLCKLRDAELLEPLVPSCRACLDHRLSYVRKNAVLAVNSIFKHQPHLIPDAPDLIQAFLVAETDFTCKRNAFIMLCNTSPDKAVEYLKSVYDQIPNFDELLQLAIIDLIRKDSKTNTTDRARYIRIIFDLLNATSQSVKYEAANSLISLTSNATAIKAAANCYLELVTKESDNNIKSIVLDRFNDLRTRYPGYLNELVMDLLRVLSSTDIDVRRKALKIALKLVNNSTVKDMIAFLQKELNKTHDQDFEKNNEYREVLIQAIHECAIRFPDVASNVVTVLMEFLAEGASSAAVDVVAFVKEVAEKFEDLRAVIMRDLLTSFGEIKSSKALRGALWIVGEYCQDVETIEEAWQKIRDSLGEIPIVASEQRNLERTQQEEQQETESIGASRPSASSSRRILQDGTYATESSVSASYNSQTNTSHTSRPPIRSLLLKGDYFVGTVVAATITKLALRYESLESDVSKVNSLKAEGMLIMTSIIRVGQSQFTHIPIEEDSYDRIMDHIKLLTTPNRNADLENVLKTECRQAFTQTILSNQGIVKKLDTRDSILGGDSIDSAPRQVAVDDKIIFRQLAPPSSQGLEDEYEQDLTKATGEMSAKENFATKLDRIVQLSGFSDTVYCEAVVEVHQYDILLDILLVNQTSETLQNLTVEFATLGDLRVVEKPAPFNLGPLAFHSLKSSIKVSSTETGVIFGNIVYDLGSGNSGCVVLNDIHVDIMDYIHPAHCSENQFRSMWTEFEWENKVSVTTPIGNLSEFLDQILKATNMATLTPQKALSGDCGFLSANLYAQTIFGEDALANLSIEKQGDGPITGHVRIRSKAQGLALSLGDKVTLAQKEISTHATQNPEPSLITVA